MIPHPLKRQADFFVRQKEKALQGRQQHATTRNNTRQHGAGAAVAAGAPAEAEATEAEATEAEATEAAEPAETPSPSPPSTAKQKQTTDAEALKEKVGGGGISYRNKRNWLKSYST